nr:hypothetical protein [Candidatus Sigynarchaeota archaeon]
MKLPSAINKLLVRFGLVKDEGKAATGGQGTAGTAKDYRDYLWQEPGFHRTLGSLWFQYLPYVLTAFFSIIYFVIILPTEREPALLARGLELVVPSVAMHALEPAARGAIIFHGPLSTHWARAARLVFCPLFS